MKYRHALLAGVLAGVALSASAYDGDVVVESDQACPEGTFRSVPYYSWKDGGFVHAGWVCESPYKDGN
ncbi:MAG TPA: hypothetical protein VFC18_17555 [Burkholderiales bacterium]|nr:hypothetical protein [Burkholderiales bacterium]